ncbi:MAG TPA: hypothetical protein PLF80_03215 [Flavobacteriales bacterium]|nr:hypothetical protein [Flavobacteriales bacterium]
MDLLGTLADQFGNLTLRDFPGMLLSMVLAALAALLLGWGARAERGTARELIALAAVVALGSLLARGSLPLSVLFAGAFIAGMRMAPSGQRADGLVRTAVVMAAVGCGSGAALPVILGMIIVLPLMRWATARSGGE